jgi:hypothetical protein
MGAGVAFSFLVIFIVVSPPLFRVPGYITDVPLWVFQAGVQLECTFLNRHPLLLDFLGNIFEINTEQWGILTLQSSSVGTMILSSVQWGILYTQSSSVGVRFVN